MMIRPSAESAPPLWTSRAKAAPLSNSAPRRYPDAMRILSSLAALALLAAPLPAIACSVASGYRAPSNLELVQDADLILLGIVTPGDAAPDSGEAQTIEVHPVDVLKGDFSGETLRLPGAIDPGAQVVLSNPYELKEPHPQSFAGACTRYAFAGGTRVLFFLKKQGDGWQLAGGPFSRSAEDVLADDDPWMQIVRFYAEVARLPADEHRIILEGQRDEWAGDAGNPVARLLAADVARQLEGPNEPLKEDLPPAPEE